MVQTLGLHLPPYPRANKRNDTQERTERLFLLSSIYALDQTLSMTFGRSPLFQISDAQLMDVPDSGMLQQYAPHRNRGSPSRVRQSGKMNPRRAEALSLNYEDILQNFGAFTFLQEIHLSKIVARIHEDLYKGNT